MKHDLRTGLSRGEGPAPKLVMGHGGMFYICVGIVMLVGPTVSARYFCDATLDPLIVLLTYSMKRHRLFICARLLLRHLRVGRDDQPPAAGEPHHVLQ